MTERPAPVRITDYRDPQFGPEVAELRASVVPIAEALQLEPDALLDDARGQTGLDDFGDPSFRERLDVYLHALREEAGLSAFGKLTSYTFVLGLLKNRLLIQDLLTRHPEIRDIEITAPIVVCGMPRTGTTHLHNLISTDPALRSLPYWESLEPVLHPLEVPGPGEEDPRITRTKMACDVLDAAMPLFKRMHEMTWDHVHEEIQLLAVDLSTMLMETTAVVPTWRDYYQAHDQTPHYEYLRTVLQVLTWLRGGERWVLKSPQHIEQFPALRAVFPDATYVVTHRDPLQITLSLTTMVSYTARMNVEHPDPLRYGAYWAPRVQQMLEACVRDHDVLPPEQTVDVRFHDFMAGDVATVERIYEVAGQPFTPETHAAMDAFVAAHPRGRYGTVVYEPADFGLDPAERRAALQPYVDRFDVEWEMRR